MLYFNELSSLLKLITFLALLLQEIREPLLISDLDVTPAELPRARPGWCPTAPVGQRVHRRARGGYLWVIRVKTRHRGSIQGC